MPGENEKPLAPGTVDEEYVTTFVDILVELGRLDGASTASVPGQPSWRRDAAARQRGLKAVRERLDSMWRMTTPAEKIAIAAQIVARSRRYGNIPRLLALLEAEGLGWTKGGEA